MAYNGTRSSKAGLAALVHFLYEALRLLARAMVGVATCLMRSRMEAGPGLYWENRSTIFSVFVSQFYSNLIRLQEWEKLMLQASDTRSLGVREMCVRCA